MAKPDMNPRTCIVSREEKSPEDMIRFVLGPDGQVVPDLKRKLPGRGVWVSNDRKMLEKAIAEKAFARGFKQAVSVDKGLSELADQLLERDCFNTLAMARKAGQAVTGFMKVDKLVRTGDISVLIHASDAKEDGKNKLAQALRVCELDDVMIVDVFDGTLLDKVLGNDNTVHVAITPGGLARDFVVKMERLNRYRGLNGN